MMGKQLFRRKFRLFSKFFSVKQQKVSVAEQQKSPTGTVPTKPQKQQSPLENLSPKVQPKPAVSQISVSEQSQQRCTLSESQQAQTQQKQAQQQGGSFYSQKVWAGSMGCRTEPVGFAQTSPTGMSPMLGFEPMAQSQWGGSTAMLVTGRRDLQQAVDIEEIWNQPTVVLKPWEIQCGA